MRLFERCGIHQARTARVSSPFEASLELELTVVLELDSAADARERDREIAQLIQENDADDDMDEL